MEKKGIQQRSHQAGNTIAEYSVMIGLVAVASIGALSLFGDSVSKVLNQSSQGSNANAMKNMANLEFGGGSGGTGSAGGGNTYALNGAPGLKAKSFLAKPGGNDGSLNQALLGTGSSDGVNATSVDGNVQVQAVHKTVATAQKLQEIADAMPDGALKQWYKFAAQETFLLAGNEASLSYQTDNVQSLKSLAEPNMQVGDALYEMGNHYSQLGNALLSIPPDATAQQKAQAAALVNGVMSSMSASYADTLNKYTTMSDSGGRKSMTLNVAQLQADNVVFGQTNYTKTAEQVQAMASSIVSSGAADSTPAVKTSLTNGMVLGDK